MSYRQIEIAFDDSAIVSELESLSPESLQHILKLLLGDGADFPFNIFLCENPLTSIARSPDQILIGLQLSLNAKCAAAA